PFPPIEDRADMLEEQLTILRGLWEEPDGWRFDGRHYQIDDARFRAKPGPRAQARLKGREGGIRLIVGGDGTPRSLRIAARFADEFNLSSSDPVRAADRYKRLDEACRAAGRDPASISRSSMVGVLIGKDKAELHRRTKELMHLLGVSSGGDAWLAERRSRWSRARPDGVRIRSGVAVPSRAATGAGRPGASGTTRRPAGVSSTGSSRSAPSAAIAALRSPSSAAAESTCRARSNRSARRRRSERMRTRPVS